MKELDDSVIKIRNAVRYVRSSPARLLIFKRCIEMEEIKFKGLVGLDVETRWNSTYVMLRASLAPRMVEALVCTQNWLRSKPLINDSEAVPLDALSDPNEDQANDFLDSSPFILTEDDGLIIDA